jgi:hypothetical protein
MRFDCPITPDGPLAILETNRIGGSDCGSGNATVWPRVWFEHGGAHFARKSLGFR